MMTPPLSISAKPVFNRNSPVKPLIAPPTAENSRPVTLWIIDAAPTQRLAATNTPRRAETAAEESVLPHREDAVFAARRYEPAASAEHQPQRQSIGADQRFPAPHQRRVAIPIRRRIDVRTFGYVRFFPAIRFASVRNSA
jgi:hypothetical protein